MPGRLWGRLESSSKAYQNRLKRLLSEGFSRQEALRLAEGKIGTNAMRRGRRVRTKWLKDVMSRGITTREELDAAVDDMYDTYDWYDPWSQFYPEA